MQEAIHHATMHEMWDWSTFLGRRDADELFFHTFKMAEMLSDVLALIPSGFRRAEADFIPRILAAAFLNG